jgi:putative addiction module component (TIGR02574 family)
MTLAALEKEVLARPPSSRVRIAEKILASVDDFVTPALAKAWESELERRTKEIKEGRAGGIAADEVLAEARRKVNEARRLSSARRK